MGAILGTEHADEPHEEGVRAPAGVAAVPRQCFQCSICSASFDTALSLHVHHTRAHAPPLPTVPPSRPRTEDTSAPGWMWEAPQPRASVDKNGFPHFFFAPRPFHPPAPRARSVQEPQQGSRAHGRQHSTTASHTVRSEPTCDVCNRVFVSKHALVQHNNAKHAPVPSEPTCDVCNRVFVSEHALEQHNNAKHAPVPSELTCDVCNRVFVSEHALEQHNNAKHVLYQVTCDTCGRAFGSERALEQHEEAVHWSEYDEEATTEDAYDSDFDGDCEDHSHPPPFPDAKGYWVNRDDFERSKSFGWFECENCDHRWMSALAYWQYGSKIVASVRVQHSPVVCGST